MSDVLKVSVIAYSATKCKLRIFQNIIRVCKKITKCMCMQFKEIFPLKQNIGEINFFLIFLKSLTFWRVARENHGFHSFTYIHLYCQQ